MTTTTASEIKIDELHINQVIDTTRDLQELLSRLATDAANTSNDIFVRYKAYSVLATFNIIWKYQHEALQSAYNFGFMSNNPVFNTPAFESGGWQTAEIKDNPFFENNSDATTFEEQHAAIVNFVEFLKTKSEKPTEH